MTINRIAVIPAKVLLFFKLVECDEELLAVGKGSIINIYSLGTIESQSLFQTDLAYMGILNISGIINFENFLCIYGGRIICLLQIKQTGPMIVEESIRYTALLDHIVCANQSSSYCLNLVLSHGQIVSIDLKTLDTNKVIINPGHHLILSATSLGSNFYALGSVFDGIDIIQVTGNLSIKMGHLTGHKGSIFDLSFDGSSRLASVSDDRLVCVYDIQQILSKTFVNLGNPDLSPTKRTKIVDSSIFQNDLDPSLVLRGHLSRVWRVKWAGKNQLLSCGEDACVRVWNLENNTSRSLFTDNLGQNTWCLALSVDSKIIAIGSDDCSIRLVDISCLPPTHAPLQKLSNHTLQDDLVIFKNQTESSTSNQIKGFHLLDRQRTVLNYEDGSLALIKKSMLECIPLSLHQKNTFSKSILICSIDPLNILIGTLKGEIFSLSLETYESTIIYSEKNPSMGRVSFLHYSHEKLIAFIGESVLVFNNFLDKDGRMAPQLCFIEKQPESKICCCSFDLDTRTYYLGLRNGWIYALNCESKVMSGLIKVSDESVTSIRVKNNFLFLSTHDGYIMQLDCAQSEMIIWRQRVARGVVEQLNILANGNILFVAFEGSDMILRDLTDRTEICRVNVGGRHRQWRLELFLDNYCDRSAKNYMAKTNLYYCLGFLRKGQIYLSNLPMKSHHFSIIKPIHGQVIRFVETISINSLNYLVTGSEDGSVALLDSRLCVLDRIYFYRGGLKCATVLGDSVICGTLTGFVVIVKVRECKKLSIHTEFMTKNETRIMGIAAWKSKTDTLHIVTIESDGFMRFFADDNHPRSFEKINEVPIHVNHCPLKIVSLTTKNIRLLVTGGTDGMINAIILRGEDNCFDVKRMEPLKTHCSGVNSLIVVKTDDKTIHFWSGGDDGYVSKFEFSLDEEKLIRCKDVMVSGPHHYSTVTGLIFIPPTFNTPHGKVFSVSLDQTILQWNSDEYVACTKYRTNVADACGFTFIPTGLLVLAGVGLESLDII